MEELDFTRKFSLGDQRDLEIKAMRERELRIFGWVSKLEIL